METVAANGDLMPCRHRAWLVRQFHLVRHSIRDPARLTPPVAVRVGVVDPRHGRELIGRDFDMRLSEVSLGRLRKLELSTQRPLYRAYQQHPEAVARWKAETYPKSAVRPPV
jgi:Winged helix-turn helix